MAQLAPQAADGARQRGSDAPSGQAPMQSKVLTPSFCFVHVIVAFEHSLRIMHVLDMSRQRGSAAFSAQASAQSKVLTLSVTLPPCFCTLWHTRYKSPMVRLAPDVMDLPSRDCARQ